MRKLKREAFETLPEKQKIKAPVSSLNNAFFAELPKQSGVSNHRKYAPCHKEPMLGDIGGAEYIYLACGNTDMRKSIDGLSAIVQQNFQLDPFSNSLFLFCGCRLTASKLSIGKAMDLFFYIRDLKADGSSGHEHKKRFV